MPRKHRNRTSRKAAAPTTTPPVAAPAHARPDSVDEDSAEEDILLRKEERSVPVLSGRLDKLGELLSDPARRSILIQLFKRLTVKDLITCSMYLNTVITSSSGLQLRLRRWYHGLAPPFKFETAQGWDLPKESNDDTLCRLLQRERALADVRPAHVRCFHIPHAQVVDVQDGYMLVLESRERKLVWPNDPHGGFCLDTFSVWQLPCVDPATGRARTPDASAPPLGARLEQGMWVWRYFVGGGIINGKLRPVDNVAVVQFGIVEADAEHHMDIMICMMRPTPEQLIVESDPTSMKAIVHPEATYPIISLLLHRNELLRGSEIYLAAQSCFSLLIKRHPTGSHPATLAVWDWRQGRLVSVGRYLHSNPAHYQAVASEKASLYANPLSHVVLPAGEIVWVTSRYIWSCHLCERNQRDEAAGSPGGEARILNLDHECQDQSTFRAHVYVSLDIFRGDECMPEKPKPFKKPRPSDVTSPAIWREVDLKAAAPALWLALPPFEAPLKKNSSPARSSADRYEVVPEGPTLYFATRDSGFDYIAHHDTTDGTLLINVPVAIKVDGQVKQRFTCLAGVSSGVLTFYGFNSMIMERLMAEPLWRKFSQPLRHWRWDSVAFDIAPEGTMAASADLRIASLRPTTAPSGSTWTLAVTKYARRKNNRDHRMAARSATRAHAPLGGGARASGHLSTLLYPEAETASSTAITRCPLKKPSVLPLPASELRSGDGNSTVSDARDWPNVFHEQAALPVPDTRWAARQVNIDPARPPRSVFFDGEHFVVDIVSWRRRTPCQRHALQHEDADWQRNGANILTF